MLVFLSVILLLGCSENTPSSEGTSSETGAIALNIIMEDSQPDVGESVFPRAMRDECGDADQYQISWVRAQVYSTPFVDGTWACSLGGGLLEDVPTGNNLRLVVIGLNAQAYDNVTIYSAETLVNVVAGQTAIATIVAEDFYVDKDYPGPDANNVGPDNIKFEWYPVSGADTYRIFVTDREDYSDPALVVFIDYDTTNTSFTYDDSLEGDTTYYWGVYPIDFDGYEGYGSVWPFTTGAGSDDNYENNDSIDEAVDLPQSVNLSSIDGPGIAVFQDFDFYKIVVPYNSATIEINCIFSHVDGDIDIELLDAAGNVIGAGDSGDDNEILVYVHSSDLSSTTYYIKVYIYGEDPPTTYDLIWYAGGINLTAMQYLGNLSFSVDPDVLVWGQELDINWAITNNGTEAIPAGTNVYVSFYLSEDAIFTGSEQLGIGWLDPIFDNGFGPGSSLYGTTNWQLPPSSPFSANSGIFYIGMAVDIYDAVAETNEDDNSGTGSGIDYAPVDIAPFN